MNEKTIIQQGFPQLKRPRSFEVTSPITAQYNCIAWAAGVNNQWWWPIDGKYWPSAAPRELTLDAFVRAFELIGYQVCSGLANEPEFERVAIYVNSQGLPTHMARQLVDGQWTSKLGPQWDITHKSTSGIEGQVYGSVSTIMKRPRL